MSKNTARNILFLKVGTAFSEPKGFYRELASEFLAKRHVVDRTGKKTYRHPRVTSGNYSEAIAKMATDLLNGNNVLFDQFVTKQPQRERIIERINTRTLGVIPVTLCVKTPFYVICDRLIETLQSDRSCLSDRRDQEYNNMAGSLSNSLGKIQWPQPTTRETLDRATTQGYVINVDGTRSTELLVQDVKDQLAELNLPVALGRSSLQLVGHQ